MVDPFLRSSCNWLFTKCVVQFSEDTFLYPPDSAVRYFRKSMRLPTDHPWSGCKFLSGYGRASLTFFTLSGFYSLQAIPWNLKSGINQGLEKAYRSWPGWLSENIMSIVSRHKKWMSGTPQRLWYQMWAFDSFHSPFQYFPFVVRPYFFRGYGQAMMPPSMTRTLV